MENMRKKNLNAHVWGGKEEFNAEGADAVVCIAITDLGDKTNMRMFVEGAFSVADYMRIYERLTKAFGEEHMKEYMAMKAMERIIGRIVGEESDDESEGGSGEAESRDGEAADCN